MPKKTFDIGGINNNWRVAPRWRSPRQLEHEEQKALFKWASYQTSRLPELSLLFAIPNGGKRSKAVAGKLKAEGVKAGVPDICLPVARGSYHGLYIELKAERGKVTPLQYEWAEALTDQGYLALVCHGWERAKAAIEKYLEQKVFSQE